MKDFTVGLRFDRSRLFNAPGRKIDKTFVDKAFEEFPEAKYIPVLLSNERFCITRERLYFPVSLTISENTPLYVAILEVGEAGLKNVPFWVSADDGNTVLGASCLKYLEELSGEYSEYLKLQEGILLNSSPLTKMPGVKLLKEKIAGFSGRPFGILFGDLNYFKQFNDRYGQAKGDEAILLAAEIFKAAEDEVNSSFHAGGDEFFFVSGDDIEDIKEIGKRIALEFDDKIRELLPPPDKNGFTAKTRDGAVKRIKPGIGISGIWTSAGNLNYDDFTYLVTSKFHLKDEVKRICERTGKSDCIVKFLEDPEIKKENVVFPLFSAFKAKGYCLYDYIIFLAGKGYAVKTAGNVIYSENGRIQLNGREIGLSELKKKLDKLEGCEREDENEARGIKA